MTGLLNKILSIFKSKPHESIKVVEAYRRGKEIYFYILAPCQPGVFESVANRNDLFLAVADVYIKVGCNKMQREKPFFSKKLKTKISSSSDIARTLLNDEDRDYFPSRVVFYRNNKVLGGMTHDLDYGLFCKVVGIERKIFEKIFNKRGIAIKWLNAPLSAWWLDEPHKYMEPDYFNLNFVKLSNNQSIKTNFINYRHCYQT